MASPRPPTPPYDILSTIFQAYFEGILIQYLDRPPRPRMHEGPLLLSHVCQYWRDVAFSMPKLWSTLTIDDRLGYPLISQFLSLARESPLSLHVSLWPCGGGRSDAKTLDLLLSHVTRWQSICFWLDEDAAEGILRGFNEIQNADVRTSVHREVSILEEAALEGGFSVSTETSRKLWSYFLNRNYFPHLRKLQWALDLSHFDSLTFASTDDTQHFGWDRLTHLSLSRPPSMPECLLLLQRCANLQTLSVDFRSAPSHTPSHLMADFPLTSVTPPKSLRELTIRVDKLATGRVLGRFTRSQLNSANLIVDIRA